MRFGIVSYVPPSGVLPQDYLHTYVIILNVTSSVRFRTVIDRTHQNDCDELQARVRDGVRQPGPGWRPSPAPGQQRTSPWSSPCRYNNYLKHMKV